MTESYQGWAKAWLFPAICFAVVLITGLWLVAVAGTDIPFHDQWGIEGGWLYPAWREGSLHAVDLVRPFNEHRIVWTHLLNLGIFVANGQWDPLVQLVAITGLRAACAAGIVWRICADQSGRGRILVTVVVTLAYLPHLPWHIVLWGIESHAGFVLGLSLLALHLLGRADRSIRQTLGGLAAGGAALLAMGPGALVPVALLGLLGIDVATARRLDRRIWKQAWPALLLLTGAMALRASVPEHARLGAASWTEFFGAAGRMLAWPHVGQPWAAFAMNLPIVALVAGRVWRRRRAVPGENFVLLAAGWSVGVALATAWVRGGSDELVAGVPSRYVDFIVQLPLANLWCICQLVSEVRAQRKISARLVTGAWCVFLLVGWLGLSAQVWRGIVRPRMRDPDAPVRLMQAFQRSDDAAVYAGQPRLLVPHPNLESVRAVLHDPRMAGALPPSLQPEQAMGSLSRATRWLLGR
jgi:hypothetical protein